MLIRAGANQGFGFPISGPQAQPPADIGGGGAGYAAKAVNFDNSTTWIRRSLPIVGGATIHKYLASWWFRDMTEQAGNTSHSISCFCTYPNIEMEFTGVFADGGGNNIFATMNQNDISVVNGATSGSDAAIFPGTGWMHAAMSFDVTNGDPNNVYQLYVNGASVAVSQVYPGSHGEGFMDFGSSSQETDIFFLEDGYGDEKATGSVADIQLWCGIAPDLSVSSNLAKLISAGKPVDPATAAAAFGQQAFLFSGDASSFANNQGSAGSCVLTGALTNATTSPSD
jgi:hypothetical protein